MSLMEQKFTLRGVEAVPMLMHNVQGADVMSPYAERMDKLMRAKKGKAAKADFNEKRRIDTEIARCEWEAALYFQSDIGPYIPSGNLLSTLVEGARALRLGATVERGVRHMKELRLPLMYAGPRTIEGLWTATDGAERPFVDRRAVVVGTARVLRTRPCFTDWSLSGTLYYETSMITADALVEAFEAAGHSGIGDFRPRFGRFVATLG